MLSDCLFLRFKIKYHPEESVKRKEEQLSALKVLFTNNTHVFFYFIDYNFTLNEHLTLYRIVLMYSSNYWSKENWIRWQ